MKTIDTDVIGKGMTPQDNGVDNITLIQVNDGIRSTAIERIGKELRGYMSAMKPIM